MNKKGVLQVIVTLVILLVFLVTFLYYMLDPDSVLPKLAKKANEFADKVFGSWGQGNILNPNEEIPQTIRDFFSTFDNIFKTAGDAPCIVSSNIKFKSGLGDYNLVLKKKGNKGYAELQNKEGQLADGKEIGKIPCIVEDTSNQLAVANFKKNYYLNSPCEKNNCLSDYSETEELKINAKEITIERKKYGFIDGLYYKKDDNHVCFLSENIGEEDFFGTLRLGKIHYCDKKGKEFDKTDCSQYKGEIECMDNYQKLCIPETNDKWVNSNCVKCPNIMKCEDISRKDFCKKDICNLNCKWEQSLYNWDGLNSCLFCQKCKTVTT